MPSDELSVSKIRLICLSDAAEYAAGAAVYVGRKLLNGSWTCSLISAKSKLLSATIPRNELSAVLLMTELAFIVKKSLGEKVDDIIYVTDSTIALSWCHNEHRKLRLFTLSRVETIRRMIEWTTNSSELPLYHIEGELNIADLLTKKHNIFPADVSAGSPWQIGMQWMTLDVEDMPLKKYNELIVNTADEILLNVECFEEPVKLDPSVAEFNPLSTHLAVSANSLASGRVGSVLIVDPVYYGWLKAIRIINLLLTWRKKANHRTHNGRVEDCYFCVTGKGMWNSLFVPARAENYLFRYESTVMKRSLKADQLKKYKEVDGIFYFHGRLNEETPLLVKDMDNIPILDLYEFTGKVPVVLVDSPVLYSYVMYVHLKVLPHAGVEATVREVCKKMMVPEGLRKLIRRIRADCTKCRLIKKKTVELEMSGHPQARTILAPPYYSVMLDIAYGFCGQAYKRARTKVKIYALVIVCILTGATNILALEGIETQDVVQALERHSARYGVPSDVYVDNGTQLIALEQAEFSIRDLTAQMFDRLGMKIHVSTPKSHEERGRVERRIGLIRSMLEKMGVHKTSPMTCVQWETLFAKVANTLDNLPLAKGNTSNLSFTGFEILTANRIKLGRNNSRSLESHGFDIELSHNLVKLLENNREIYYFWYQMFVENIHLLTLKPNKWSVSTRPPRENDIVLFVVTDSGYSKESVVWKLGVVVKVMSRKVEISYAVNVTRNSPSTMSVVERNFRDVSIIFSVEELGINLNEYLSVVSSNV